MIAANRRRLVAASHASIGVLLLGGIWLGLPARYLPVDVGGSLLAGCALSAAAGLGLHRRWGLALARLVAWLELLAGTLVISLLALSAAQLAGSYGPVGGGGALLMGAVALLVLPYLVVLPALQLAWLRDSI